MKTKVSVVLNFAPKLCLHSTFHLNIDYRLLLYALSLCNVLDVISTDRRRDSSLPRTDSKERSTSLKTLQVSYIIIFFIMVIKCCN